MNVWNKGHGLWLFALCLAGCSRNEGVESLQRTTVTLPGGQHIEAEMMLTVVDMQRGMMFRTSLPEGRGLLFLYAKPGRYPFWTPNVKVPLDIIWIDRARTIVEIAADTPPCPETDPLKCPGYGGKVDAQFILELGAGMAKKYGLSPGQSVSF